MLVTIISDEREPLKVVDCPETGVVTSDDDTKEMKLLISDVGLVTDVVSDVVDDSVILKLDAVKDDVVDSYEEYVPVVTDISDSEDTEPVVLDVVGAVVEIEEEDDDDTDGIVILVDCVVSDG